MYVHSARCPPQAENTITLGWYDPQKLTPKTQAGNVGENNSPIGRSGGEFSSSELTFFDGSYCLSQSSLLQWHIKDPGHSAKSAGGRFHQICKDP